MLVYSQKILAFISEIKQAIREILSEEMGLSVRGNRFYVGQSSYPLSVVIYDHKNMLGYFESEFYELGFHERMMEAKKELLRDLIRHELGHYMTFIKHGLVPSHGAEYREVCRCYGWGESVYKATLCLQEASAISSLDSSILRKVQKLIALSKSGNAHEAEEALIKSQQLLLKYNVEFVETSDEEKIYLKRLLKQKKENGKMRAIAKILENFFVSAVYRKGDGFIVLEILGSLHNIEIAEYVAEFLDQEMEKLWQETKRLSHLSGLLAKNSFFLGIAKGYCQKMQGLKRDYSKELSSSVMVLEKKLAEQKALVYERLTTTRSQGSHCQKSSSLGEQLGRKLHISSALGNPSPSRSCTHLLAQTNSR